MKVISLGWGVQSFTLAAMSALGELEPVDVALHGDTTWERQATYDFARQWTPWLEKMGVRVVTVSDVTQAQKAKTGEPDIPAHLQKVSIVNKWNNPEIPGGMLRRQCTGRWKIDPMRRWLTEELQRLGLSKISGCVEQWLGITLDEIERAKDSDNKWQVNRFPLLEKRMTRQDCIIWLQSHGLPVPQKSSCVFCPYHRRTAWIEMKRANGPDWATAIEVDEAIRNKRPGYIAYVHHDHIPLIELKIAEDFGATQLNMFSGIPQAAKIIQQEEELYAEGYRVIDNVWKKVTEPEITDTTNAECDSGYCFL